MSQPPEEPPVKGSSPPVDTPSESSTDAASVTDVPAPEPDQEQLRVDEPADEPTAAVVSADPAGDLADPAELRAGVEALLFSSPEALSVRKMAGALGDTEPKRVRAALAELSSLYENEGRGIQIVEAPGGYQMATRSKFAQYVLRLGTKKKPPTMSGAMLETLAIVAYRQPVIRAVVESIRGVESSGVLRNLLDLGMIEVVGHKEVIGRPRLYGTNEKFLRTFGMSKLADLPTIRGLREDMQRAEADEAARAMEAHVDIPESSADEQDDEAEVAPDIESAEASADESADEFAEDSADELTEESPEDSGEEFSADESKESDESEESDESKD